MKIKLSNCLLLFVTFLAISNVPAQASVSQPDIFSTWTNNPPNIDGLFSAGEWSNPQLEILSPIHTFVYFVNDADNLYIMVDAANAASGDYTDESLDHVRLDFDTKDRNTWNVGYDDMFILSGKGGSGTLEHYILDTTAPSWGTTLDGGMGQVGYSASPNSATNHKMYEFKIPLSRLQSNAPDGSIGFAAPEYPVNSIPYDSNGGNPRWNTWPAGSVYDNLLTWGDLFLAAPTKVPALTPIGLAALAGLLGLLAVATLRRRL